MEPISIDEAFLDLSGTERLHRGCPARTLADFAQAVEAKLGITVTVGLSHNKFLAKLGSGLGKPNGFFVIGRDETVSFLEDKPVGLIWGVGDVLQARLARDGIALIGHLRALPEEELQSRYGDIGRRLFRFSRGEDFRRVEPGGRRKSLSAETTFSGDIGDLPALKRKLWSLCEKVSSGLKKEQIAGCRVTLKLKTTKFRLRTRSTTLPHPTVLAEVIYEAGLRLLMKEADGTLFRLIGIGLSGFSDPADADPPDLADSSKSRLRAVEETVDTIRSRFGQGAIAKGRRLE